MSNEVTQADEQPDTHDMTDAECATAYRDLRRRANDAGFATVGEWIDEQPDTQLAFYEWRSGIERDVRVWDLTDGELKSLFSALRAREASK